MNNKNEKVAKKESINKKSTSSRFQKAANRANPSRLFKNIFLSFKQKNVYKQPSFWLANLIFVFFSFKIIQLSLFLNQFSVAIPREEGITNMIYLDSNIIKGMKTDVLFKYLDNLEKLKSERQTIRERNENKKF
jgi:hypothetical protein